MDLNQVVRRAGEALSVGRSFGPAYEHDGTLVVPVALVTGGGGGGLRNGQGAETPDESDGEAVGTTGGDAGGGFGGLVYPIGAYVVREGRVRFAPSVDVNLIVVCGLLLFRMLLKGSRKRRVHR